MEGEPNLKYKLVNTEALKEVIEIVPEAPSSIVYPPVTVKGESFYQYKIAKEFVY